MLLLCTKNMTSLSVHVSQVTLKILTIILWLNGFPCIIISSSDSNIPSTTSVALLYPRLTVNNQTESEDGMHWSRQSRDTSVATSIAHPINHGQVISTHMPPLRRVITNHVQYQHKPHVSKGLVLPVHEVPGEETASDGIFGGSFQQGFVTITPMYAKDSNQFSFLPPHYSLYPSIKSVKGATAAGEGSVFAPIYPFSSSGFDVEFMDASFPGWGSNGIQQTLPVKVTELKKESKWDMKKFGILLLIKIGLAKLKAFGILKLMFLILLKFKLALTLLLVKFVLFLTAIKFFKALILPLFLLAFLPLLLLMLPLLLLPLLLPLLLLLLSAPLRMPQVVVKDQPNRVKMLDYMNTHKSDVVMEIMSQLMDSEKCIERIACQLATKKESKILYPILKWYLSKLGNTIRNERITSYVQAYLKTVKEYNGPFGEKDGHDWCFRKFKCDREEDLTDTKAGLETSDNEKVMKPDATKL